MFKISSIVSLGLFLLLSFSLSSQDVTAASAYNEGLKMLKGKDFENGLMNMEKALEMAQVDENEQIIGLAKKNGAIAAYNLGNAKRKAGDLENALMLYKKGTELSPAYSSNFEGIARIHEKNGETLTSMNYYMLAGQKASEEGRAEKAQNRMKKAETMVGKAFVAKNYDSSIELGKAYISVDDKNAEVNYYLARSLSEKEMVEEAITHMNKAIELSGANVEDKYHFYLGEQLEKAGKKAEAAASYRKVMHEKYKAQAEYRAGQLGG